MALGALVVVAATLSACGTGSATPAQQLGVRIPEGWTTHTYDGIAISVPAGWRYYGPGTEVACPGTQDGTLAIDVTYTGAGCPYLGPPSGSGMPTMIQIQPGLGSGSPSTHGARVNGVNVKVLDNAAGALAWLIPSLNLTVSGSGPDADKVLHTLRPA